MCLQRGGGRGGEAGKGGGGVMDVDDGRYLPVAPKLELRFNQFGTPLEPVCWKVENQFDTHIALYYVELYEYIYIIQQ